MKNMIKLLGIAAIIVVIVFTACDSGNGPDSPEQLAKPIGLQIDGKTLSWTAVPGASGYTVDIDNISYNAPTKSFSLSVLTAYKTYTIKVKALGDGTTYTDSEWSDVKTYTLEEPMEISALDTPKNLQVNGTNLTWDEVINAVRYSVGINGTENEASTNSYSLSGLITPGTYTIKVKAIGDNETYKNSEWSESKEYKVESATQQLTAPSGLLANNVTKTLTWNVVANASGYTVSIDNTEYQTVTNSYSLAALTIPKTYTIKVKTKGNGTTYTDSVWSLAISYTVQESAPREPTPGLEYSLDYSFYHFTGLVGYSVQKGTATATEIVIPSEYDGLPVISISDFTYYTAMTSITIPNSILDIGYGAFNNCSGLANITVESGNSRYWSEGNCIIQFNGYDGKTGDPTDYWEGENRLILGCKNSVIPNNVDSIVEGAFYGCSGLTSITIPSGVTSIGVGKFDGELWGAFVYCWNLTSITVENGNTVYRSEGNCIIQRNNNMLILGCGNSVIPNSVTSIGNYAFYGNDLTSTIPNNVTSIGNYAFVNCDLARVTIPNSVTNIGYGAFQYCWKLIEVTFQTGSNISYANFGHSAFPQGEWSEGGDNLKGAYYTGNAGTYTREVNGSIWTKR